MSNLLRRCMSSVEDTNRRARPLGRWKDRVKEYVSEREVRENGLEWARRECVEVGCGVVWCGGMGEKEHPEMV